MKQKTLAKLGSLALIVGTPLIAFGSSKTLADIMDLIVMYFSAAIKFIIGLAVLTFIWNVYRYFVKPDAERKEAGMYVLYSVLGFFIILSLWGLVNIVSRTFNLDNSQPSWPFTGNGGGNTNPLEGQTTNSNPLGGETTNSNPMFGQTGQAPNTLSGFNDTSRTNNGDAPGQ